MRRIFIAALILIPLFVLGFTGVLSWLDSYIPKDRGAVMIRPCPNCKGQVILTPDEKVECSVCKENLAICIECGDWVRGDELKSRSERGWLCAVHAEPLEDQLENQRESNAGGDDSNDPNVGEADNTEATKTEDEPPSPIRSD